MVGVHYFYIYAKQWLKLNSGKINYSYLLNKWLVTQVQFLNYEHGIYECITVWCVFELLPTSLLIDYLLRDLWDAIFRLLNGSEIKFGQFLFNCVSSGFTNAAVYATWHVASSRLLLWCALLALCLIVRWSYETRLPRRCLL